jgi:CHAT domain-containing protein
VNKFLLFILFNVCFCFPMVGTSQQAVVDSISIYEGEGDWLNANRLLEQYLDINEPSAKTTVRWLQLFSNFISLRDQGSASKILDAVEWNLNQYPINDTALQKLGEYYHKKGVYHYRLSEYPKAIEAYTDAVSTRIAAHGESDLRVVKSLKNMGLAHFEANNFTAAIESMKESVSKHFTAKQQDKVMLYQTYSFLSYALLQVDDPDEAWLYLQPLVKLGEELFPDDKVAIAELYSVDLFEYYTEIEAFDQVIHVNKKAENILSSINPKDNDVYSALANCYNNLAINYENMNMPVESATYYVKSIKINRDILEDQFKLCRNYLNLSDLYVETNDVAKASEYSKLAGKLIPQIKDSTTISNFYFVNAKIHKAKKEFTKAEQNFNTSFTYLNASQSINRIVGGLPLYIHMLSPQITMYWDKYKRSNKIDELYRYEELFERLESGLSRLRLDINNQESKLLLSSDSRSFYEHAFTVFYELYIKTNNENYLAKCFELVEKSKALVLSEELNQRRAIIEVEIEEALLKKMTALQQEILKLKEDTSAASSDLLIKKDIELQQLTDDLKSQFPAYSSMLNNFETISLIDAQNSITDSSELIISYFFTTDHSYLIAIDKTDIAIEKTEGNYEYVQENIITLRQLIDGTVDKIKYSFEERKIKEDSMSIVAQKLYTSLIVPLGNKLKNKERLLIVPDRLLSYLPFDVLTSPGTNKYLIESVMINYAYSMTLHDFMSQDNESNYSKYLLALAPSFEHSEQLSDLPFNEEEIESIAEITNTDLLQKEYANKQSFLDKFSEYQILHLSTHAIIDDSIPGHSFIAFQEDDVDSKLSSNELFTLKSNAELIFLSACETGIGKVYKGEGVMSLARAWAATGAKSIISSLWRIDDQFTSQFSKKFYENIEDGLDRGESLWETKKHFATTSQPYYWAAFTLIGDGGQLGKQARTGFKNGLFFGVIILSLSLFTVFFFKRKQ